jgi:hypothetical protein
MRVLFLFLSILVCLTGKSQQKILFVGNSLTFYNDLPEMVRKIAKQNDRILSVTAFAKPDYALEDHWKEGSVVDAIKRKRFDVVVLQQGPSALTTSRENLMEYALRFSTLCQAQNCRLAFYMVWPSAQRTFDFENVIRSYELAADTTQASVCSVGRAWREAWAMKKDLALYAEDGFHPSESGSLIAAMVIYGTLFDQHDFDFIDPDKIVSNEIPEPDFAILKKAAQSVVRNQSDRK